MKEIKKILIANRGEIALRIMSTIHTMGISSVAVFSDADRDSLYVKFADEAIAIGGYAASESYLDQDKIIEAAKISGADAIHPGYGFLSENASFAKRCREEGITFIGPSPEVIEKLGSKAAAKEIMRNAGVPVVPGYEGEDQSVGRFKYEAGEIGFPVLLKASAGGGGRGMRIVQKESELESAIEDAAREAEKSFGDGKLLMEKYFPRAKHIEFQIFGDEQGNHIHLFERECSMQRRYQKVIEEAPSPSLTDELRTEMGHAALSVAQAVNYTNAGTVEFLLDEEGNYFFLEVNTRLQVEHAVTEMTVGVDIVNMQIEVAKGLPLQAKQEDLDQYGHSIECRICAEDPENNFMPATGTFLLWKEHFTVYNRYDTSVNTESRVEIHYDSMIAKVVTYGENRNKAISQMQGTLINSVALGVTTNIDFLRDLLATPEFTDGSFDTKLIERNFSNYERTISKAQLHESVIAALVYSCQLRSKSNTFAHSLNSWRNIFYAPHPFIVERKDSEIQAFYRYRYPKLFDISIEGINYEVELRSSDLQNISILINRHLKNFIVASKRPDFFVHHPTVGHIKLKEKPVFGEQGTAIEKDGYYASMPGEIIKVLVKPGDHVKSGQRLLVISSMKMETTVEAHADGEIETVYVQEKSFVEAETVLLKMKE